MSIAQHVLLSKNNLSNYESTRNCSFLVSQWMSTIFVSKKTTANTKRKERLCHRWKENKESSHQRHV